jgi:nitroimidazol reductase NimA-like FMN-containing flavoprotein (pyridoxamine 5'-phosphate oxidase superfamily)
MTQLAPTPRTRLKRRAQRGSFDREVVNAILDEGFVCSVAFLHDGKPCVIPTLYARGGDFLFLHGSPANRMLRSLCEPGHEACISVFHADALVLARSAFHHSINYRSVVLYAQAEEIVDADEKHEALRTVVEHVVPGRWKDVRSPNLEEFRGTLVLRVPIVEASAKIRDLGVIDDEADLQLGCWAGLLPMATRFGTPVPDALLPAAVPVPPYVSGYTRAR